MFFLSFLSLFFCFLLRKRKRIIWNAHMRQPLRITVFCFCAESLCVFCWLIFTYHFPCPVYCCAKHLKLKNWCSDFASPLYRNGIEFRYFPFHLLPIRRNEIHTIWGDCNFFYFWIATEFHFYPQTNFSK